MRSALYDFSLSCRMAVAEAVHLIQPHLLLTNLLSTSLHMTESYFLVKGAGL